MHKKELKGLKFGRLTVIKLAGYKKGQGYLWLCKCDCGKERVFVSSRLTHNHMRGAQSCGCISKELQEEREKKANSPPPFAAWQPLTALPCRP